MSVAILLVNLGSPSTPTEEDVRAYLGEFLNDPFVIDYPAWIRRLVVDCIILKRRPARIAKLYQNIWTEEGSPLVVYSERLRTSLNRVAPYPTFLAMRYGSPSIKAVLIEIARRVSGLADLIVVPLYPQAAMATTLTVTVEVSRIVREEMPHVRITTVQPWFDDERTINLLASNIAPHLQDDSDALILSYHGVPIRHLRKMDPTGRHCHGTDSCCSTASAAHRSCYRHQCMVMTQRIADKLGVSRTQVHMTFQSRFGLDVWLDPATDAKVAELVRNGARNIVVASPAFVADCLETLEEINMGTRRVFMKEGGSTFTYVPCLNDADEWIMALKDIIEPYLPKEQGAT